MASKVRKWRVGKYESKGSEGWGSEKKDKEGKKYEGRVGRNVRRISGI